MDTLYVYLKVSLENFMTDNSTLNKCTFFNLL